MSTQLPDVRSLGPDDVPWVEAGTYVQLKVLRVDIDANVWVIENIFAPGFRAQPHKHTGMVEAFTISGRWQYVEYGIPYVAGSYLYEPANSIHTLDVPADNTEPTHVKFVMSGANLNLGADGNVESVTDAVSILAAYNALCAMNGLQPPAVLR